MVDAVRLDGSGAASSQPDDELIESMKSTVKAKLAAKIEASVDAKKKSPPKKNQRLTRLAKPNRRPNRRRPLPKTMDVASVIENLPTIALLISRLNEILNPISDPK